MQQSNGTERLNFGIDLGNSNISVAYRLISGETFFKSVLIDLDPAQKGHFKSVLPTAVLFPFDEESSPKVGRQAKNLSREVGMLFVNFKEELLRSEEVTLTTQKNLTKTSEDALTELFKYLFNKVVNSDDLFGRTKADSDGRRVLEMDYSVTVGIPTQSSEQYRDRLTRAMIKAGWFASMEDATGGSPKRLQFLAEPLAVILNFGVPGNKRYLVYDHGGATLDIADVATSETGIQDYTVSSKARITIPWPDRKDGMNVGGSVLDRLMLRSAVAEPDAVAALLPHIAEAYGLECEGAALASLIQQAETIEGSLPEHEVYRLLCADMEQVRIKFSGVTNTEMLVLNDTQETDILIRQELLNEIFLPVSNAIRECFSGMTLEDADNSGEVLCVMAGGVSLTPFFQKTIAEKYTPKPFSSEVSPFTAIATGLAQYYRGGLESVSATGSDITDTDYGIWIERDRKWEVIVPEKTPYHETRFPPEGRGIFKRFKPYPPTDEITLRVGQCIKGNWVDLGTRDVFLPSRSSAFRIYFSIDPEQGRLELRLEEAQSKRLIAMESPIFLSKS